MILDSVCRYRAYGENIEELPWSEVPSLSRDLTQYVLKDLTPGEQFQIQVIMDSMLPTLVDLLMVVLVEA